MAVSDVHQAVRRQQQQQQHEAVCKVEERLHVFGERRAGLDFLTDQRHAASCTPRCADTKRNGRKGSWLQSQPCVDFAAGCELRSFCKELCAHHVA